MAGSKKTKSKDMQAVVESIGQRIARLRKERGISQVVLSKRLGLSQSNISDYERGALRVHGELIIELSEILAVSADELLGLQKAPKHTKEETPKDLPSPRLIRRMKRIESLPPAQQRTLLRTIDTFIRGASN